MKIVIMTDLEGVAGVVSFGSQTGPDEKYYEEAKKLLTREVNAAVEAILEFTENSEILVIDGHGPGAISFEELHEEAKLLHGRPINFKYAMNKILKNADVTIMIGQHAMAGEQCGNLNHTQDSKAIEYYKLNGRLIGEIAQYALRAGAFDVPLIFLSGDEAACKEAADFIKGITTAAVKQGIGRNSAISLSAVKAGKLIKQQLKNALQKHKENPVSPLKWKPPFILEKRYFHTDRADMAETVAGVKRLDSLTVQMISDNILDII